VSAQPTSRWRLFGLFAIIAMVAALLAPSLARALQQPGRPRPPSHTPRSPGTPRVPRPPPPSDPSIVGEIERGGEEAKEHESDEPADMNIADFGNDKQPPYLAALINFGLLMGLYYAVGKKPLAEGLKNRKANIVKEIEEAQRMKREAEARAKQYQSKLAGLEDELAATRAALQESGKADRERIVKEAEEKAARMEKDTTFLLEQEVKQMRLDLQRETVDIAIAAAEELLKKQVTATDQERLAEEYLQTLHIGAPPQTPRATS
jgi:F0F1-type ATP synthase membrane subunit b/b'